MRTLYEGFITKLNTNEIFVFGSNTEGKHGSGNAKFALDKCGAKYGTPSGLQGRSYAIITKDLKSYKHPSISKENIISQIVDFYKFAEQNPELDFFIGYNGNDTYLRCGYNIKIFASFWKSAQQLNNGIIPNNIIFEKQFYSLF